VVATGGHHGDVDLVVRELGTPSVHVDVTIPADTLTGGSTPGEVPGYGPIPAWAPRTLAGTATECRGLVYHPDNGRLLGLSEVLRPGHPDPASPSSPGTRAATSCDCDHVVPYPHGPNAATNTCCLCRRHHRLKDPCPRLDDNPGPDRPADLDHPRRHHPGHRPLRLPIRDRSRPTTVRKQQRLVGHDPGEHTVDEAG